MEPNIEGKRERHFDEKNVNGETRFLSDDVCGAE
jgi:hypothetical protein